jgi:sugar phosphate isomerase/epimerase
MPGDTAGGAGVPGVRFAGVGDEAGARLADQVRAHHRLGWSAIELRNVDGMALADLDDAAFGRLARELRQEGLEVACVDSRIGNWARPVTADFAADLAELDVLAERCQLLGVRYVRVMSYPNDGLDQDEWRRVVLRRLRVLTGRAERAGLVLVHENCAGWAADRADRMRALVDAVDSPALRLLFDLGNGAVDGYDGYELLTQVADLVAHVHVKDALGAGATATFTLPGEGGCRVADCLRLLLEAGYTGTWAIEPHQRVRPHLGQLDAGPDGVDAFVAYGRALERLVEREVLQPLTAGAASPGSPTGRRWPDAR